MYTRPLTRQTVATVDMSNDTSAIGRLLIVAAINPRFCERLLNDPETAVRSGFGGEQFLITGDTMKVMAAIRKSTLPEFILQLDCGLGNRLLKSEPFEAPT